MIAIRTVDTAEGLESLAAGWETLHAEAPVASVMPSLVAVTVAFPGRAAAAGAGLAAVAGALAAPPDPAVASAGTPRTAVAVAVATSEAK